MSPKEYDEGGLNKLADKNSLTILKAVARIFLNSSVFSASYLKADVEVFAKDMSLSFGKVLGLIRIAIVGELSGAGLFEIVEIIEKTEAIKRVEALANYLKK